MNFIHKTALAGLCALAALGVATSSASAAPILYDFTSSSSTVNLGSSETYTAGGITITAYSGYLSGTTVTRSGVLVGNNRGSDEQGLGVCIGSGNTCNNGHYDDDPEIDYSPREVVQLDITNLLSNGYTSLAVNADSATGGEKLDAYTSMSSSGLGTLVGSITSAAGTVSIVQNGNYLNFISDNGSGGSDVLLHSLTATKVPEPVSMAILGTGLIGLGAVRRRRSAATTC